MRNLRNGETLKRCILRKVKDIRKIPTEFQGILIYHGAGMEFQHELGETFK
ncbi:hypothetical protein HOLleu_41335 [Holothuria leucospilota]|uniref:Uncharacterized protein n=1 Tax=Holothuria leucospilota TaxID=206669 RepID=A0A9Q0YBQ0_HOLLE|nr:hypothetical protein HOLleu_41335 [Holothuria leucospilota]